MDQNVQGTPQLKSYGQLMSPGGGEAVVFPGAVVAIGCPCSDGWPHTHAHANNTK